MFSLEEFPEDPGVRSRSAPPALWAARRFGRQLRRMSDEFQQEMLPRANSAGGTRSWREALRRWWGAPPPPGPGPPRPPP
uniref:Uncharacterized protein n=1 Tax=Melopsittacus undulatus TaxID=13146 RepID=A0A8V5GNR1_MELUD